MGALTTHWLDMRRPRKQRNRREMLTLISGLSVAGAAGCITTSPPVASSGSGNRTDSYSGPMSNSFTFWEMSGSWEHHMNQYKKKTDVSINHANMGYDQIIDRMQTRLLSGTNAPGTALIEYTSLKQVSATGGLRDLSPWIKEANLTQKFPSWIWNSVSSGNETYEIPYDVNPTSLFYRSDIWEKYGVSDDIETWDQLIEEGNKLPDNIDLISLPASALNLYWQMLYWQLGGKAFDSNGKIAFNNDTCLRVFRLLNRLSEEGLVNNVTEFSQPWFSGFSNGTITGYCSGAWFNSTLQESVSDTSGNWRAMKLPAFEKGGDRASNRGGSGLCIPTQVSDEVARRTFDFALKTVANAEEMAWLFRNIGNFSAYQPAYDQDAFSREFEFFGGQKLGQLWIDQLENIPPYRFTVDTPTIMNIINSELRKVVYGNTKPQTGLNQAIEQAKKQTGRGVA